MVSIEGNETTAKFKFSSGGLSQSGSGSGVNKNLVFNLIINQDYPPTATPFID